ncbi:MAG: GbsR/MarR family transcriptional regulator [Puniceicoccales bacterium]
MDEIEVEALAYFVEVAQMLGLPKSLGEIYAVVFLSSQPLCMEAIIRKLNISLGTASQGLRQLRQLKAVRAISIPADRRDYYEAETELRPLIGNFLAEVVVPQMESGQSRLRALGSLLAEVEPDKQAHYQNRLAKLEQWNRTGGKLIPRIAQWIRI